MSDIEVAAHELAHAMDYRYPELRKQWKPATRANAVYRDELRGVSYDQSKIFEGFAEYVRLWATQKEEAQARAPNFYQWFEGFLNRNEHGPAWRRAQEQMHQWFAQDGAARAQSKIGVTEDINSFLNGPMDRFRYEVADDLHGIFRMEMEMFGEVRPLGAYETARLVRGKNAFTEGVLLYGRPVIRADGSHGFDGKGLMQILDPVASRLDDFLLYAVGRSANELMGQGRENLFTRAEIQAMIAKETPEFRQAFQEYQEWNQAIVDFAVAKGAISRESVNRWRRSQYLPFYRVGEPGATKSSYIPGDWKGVKALTGGTGNLRDILDNMIGNASMLIDAALTNEARVKVADLSQLRGGARFMAKIPKDNKRVQVHRDEIQRVMLEALGVRNTRSLPVEVQAFIGGIIDGLDGGLVSLYMRGQAPYGGNVVAVLREGKAEYYEVTDPILYGSLLHLQRPIRHPLIRFLGGIKRISQASITLSVDFMSANLARDTLMGSIFSQHGFRPLLDSLIGIGSRITSDPNYRDFIANGGGFSSIYLESEPFRQRLEHFYTERGINPKTVLHVGQDIFYAIERIGDAFEMATRLGEYRRAIQKGKHPRHAAYSGREVSTDFAMRGANQALGFAFDTIIFLKAAVNGMDRIYRGLRHDPNKMAIATKIGLLAMASMGLAALNRLQPDYNDLEDWDRDSHWHFYIPTTARAVEALGRGQPMPEGEFEHFRYPKIWEIGGVASISERSITRLLDDRMEKFPGDVLRIVYNLTGVEIFPQFMEPFLEAGVPFTEFKGFNLERFYDRPIQSEHMLSLQKWARSGPYTSETIRQLGELTRTLPEQFQLNPAQTEALIRGFFNTWALYGLTLSDAVFFDDAPDIPVDRLPVIRRFYSRSPTKRTRYTTEFYDLVKQVTEARRTMRAMQKSYQPEIAGQIAVQQENREYQQLNAAQKADRTMSGQQRIVTSHRSLIALQDYTKTLVRNPHVGTKASEIVRSQDFNSIGALKMRLLEMWSDQRTALHKHAVTTVEEQRKAQKTIMKAGR